MGKFDNLKKRAYQCNMALRDSGLVLYTFGNVSAIDRAAGVIAIKPSGVPYEQLRPEVIVVLDLEGHVVEGSLRPSSDTPTHLVLYNKFPRIGGIAHTHSTYAVAWAQAGRPIPVLGTTHADYLHLPVPCTEFMDSEAVRGDYEVETGRQIQHAFNKTSAEEIEMVLVAGHGPFTWGATPEKAVQNSVILEQLAKTALLTLQINPQAVELPAELIEKHYRRKHGPNAYYGQKESQ
jgi:L-ribulose-5-phosphate 4-epimerase